jgi:uncharacterized protein (TIGR02677 family)
VVLLRLVGMSRTDYSTFNYVTAPNATLYRSVMREFVRAKNQFIVHLRPEELHEELAGSDATEVNKALDALTEWGNLSADPDTTRVTTVEDFHRARYLYQLTAAGEATERALLQFDDTFGRRGSLQAAALVDIASDLRALLLLARDGHPDAAKTHPLLLALVRRFTDLADNAQGFVGSLQRAIDLNGVDADAFLAYKDRLIEYLERFVHDLVTTGSEIAQLIEELEDMGIEPLLAGAAEREASDESPELDLGSPGSAGEPDIATTAERALAVWRERWLGFRRWFLSEAGHESQQRLLRNRARAAIPQLLQVVRTLNERRSGRSDRSTDLRALALWFAEAPDEASLHRLWRVAFGLAPARHLSIDADTLELREHDPVAPSTPWAEAPPMLISPRLRATGSYERRGKPVLVVDRSASRRHLAERMAAESAAFAAARAQLLTEGTVLLSELRRMEKPAFELFLRLLGDALGQRAPGRGDPLMARSPDGTLELRLAPVPAADEAQVRSSVGTLRGPQHLVEIVEAVTGL